MQKTIIEKQTFEKVSFPTYEITFDRIATRLKKVLSPSEHKEYLSLYLASQENPKGARKLVENFQRCHPSVPEVYNLLTYVYIRLKKIKKAEKLTKENFEKNPDYLFAKINYADQCLRKNRLQEISEIFETKTQLSDLYPERKTFHSSEILGFMCLMSFYHLKLGDKDSSKDFLSYAKLINRNDPAVHLLTRKLYRKSLLQRLLMLLNFKRKT